MLLLITILLVFITQWFFYHWWWIIIDTFIATLLMGRTALSSFLSGFVAVAIVWGGYAFAVNSANEGLLLAKIAKIFFGTSSGWLLMLITIIIGALVGGFSALTAYSLKALWKKKKDS